MEYPILGSGRIANIDAGNSAGDQDPLYLLPRLVEIIVHLVVGLGGFLSEEIVPDANHRVWWRGDN